MSDTPLYDQLVNERLGRGPSEFEGHDTWDDSEEARAAFERGVAQARTRQEQAAGPGQPDSSKPSAEAKPGAEEKPGLEKGPDRKQLEQQPNGEQQPVPGQKQAEEQPAAEPAAAKESGKDRTPGKPLTPA